MKHSSLRQLLLGTIPLCLAPLPAQKPVQLWRAEPLAGSVLHYCLSPTGLRAATLGEDRQVILWDTQAEKGPPLLECRLPTGLGTRLAFSPDSSILAAVGPAWQKPGLRAWRAKDGKEIKGWTSRDNMGMTGRHMRLDLSTEDYGGRIFRHPSGALVFDRGLGRECYVAADGRLPAAPGNSKQGWHLADGGKSLVLARGDAWRYVVWMAHPKQELVYQKYELGSGKLLVEDRWRIDHPKESRLPCFVPVTNGVEVAAIIGAEVRLYPIADRSKVLTFGKEVTAVVAHGDLWLTGHKDASVKTWKAGKQVAWYPGGRGAIKQLWVRGDYIGAVTEEEGIVWKKGEILARKPKVESLELGEKQFLFRGQEKVWIYEDGKLLTEVETGGSKATSHAAIGEGFVAYAKGGAMVLHDLEKKRSTAARNAHHAKVSKLEWGTTGMLARGVSGIPAAWLDSRDGKVLSRHVAGPLHVGQELVDLASVVDKTSGISAASADSRRYALRGRGRITVYESRDRKEIFKTKVTANASPIALSPDGRYLAAPDIQKKAAGPKPILRVWDLSTGKQLYEKGFQLQPWSLTFSKDSKHLRLVSFLDMTSQTEILNLEGKVVHMPGRDLTHSVFTPDAKYCVDIYHDRSVQIFDLGKQELKQKIRMPKLGFAGYNEVFPDPSSRFVVLHSRDRRSAFRVDLEKGLERQPMFETVAGQHPLTILGDGSCLVLGHDGLEV